MSALDVALVSKGARDAAADTEVLAYVEGFTNDFHRRRPTPRCRSLSSSVWSRPAGCTPGRSTTSRPPAFGAARTRPAIAASRSLHHRRSICSGALPQALAHDNRPVHQDDQKAAPPGAPR
jgi:hypothetical protein